jgi:hypothetical protein
MCGVTYVVAQFVPHNYRDRVSDQTKAGLPRRPGSHPLLANLGAQPAGSPLFSER